MQGPGAVDPRVVCLLVGGFGPLAACEGLGPEGRNEVVLRFEPAPDGAKAGREPFTITRSDIQQAFARARLARDPSLEGSDSSPNLRRHVVDRLVEARLLRAEAAARGITVTSTAIHRELRALRRGLPESQFDKHLIRSYQTEDLLREQIEGRLLAGALLARIDPEPVSDEAVRAAFEALSVEEKVVPPRVRAAQIQVPTEELGREVMRRLSKGVPFEKLARAFAPESGGQIGWFSKGEMPPVFERTCFELKPEERSDLIPSQYGHHIFKVYERREQRVRTFEEMAGQLRAELVERRRRDAEEELLSAVRAAYSVTTDDALLEELVQEGLR